MSPMIHIRTSDNLSKCPFRANLGQLVSGNIGTKLRYLSDQIQVFTTKRFFTLRFSSKFLAGTMNAAASQGKHVVFNIHDLKTLFP